jgi:hypothetical protein
MGGSGKWSLSHLSRDVKEPNDSLCFECVFMWGVCFPSKRRCGYLLHNHHSVLLLHLVSLKLHNRYWGCSFFRFLDVAIRWLLPGTKRGEKLSVLEFDCLSFRRSLLPSSGHAAVVEKCVDVKEITDISLLDYVHVSYSMYNNNSSSCSNSKSARVFTFSNDWYF